MLWSLVEQIVLKSRADKRKIHNVFNYRLHAECCTGCNLCFCLLDEYDGYAVPNSRPQTWDPKESCAPPTFQVSLFFERSLRSVKSRRIPLNCYHRGYRRSSYRGSPTWRPHQSPTSEIKKWYKDLTRVKYNIKDNQVAAENRRLGPAWNLLTPLVPVNIQTPHPLDQISLEQSPTVVVVVVVFVQVDSWALFSLRENEGKEKEIR